MAVPEYMRGNLLPGRLGIYSIFRKKKSRYDGKPHASWRLIMEGRASYLCG